MIVVKRFFAIPSIVALVVSGIYSFPVTTPIAYANDNHISAVSIPLTTQNGELTKTATQGFDIDATTDTEHTVSEVPAKSTVFLTSIRKNDNSKDIEGTAREKFTILSAPIAVNDPFAVSGVTWKTGQTLPEDATIEMRTLDGTQWSQWYGLEIVNEGDNKGERNGTEYMVSGNSQGIQVRITHTTGNLPDDLRIDISYSPDGVSQVEKESNLADVLPSADSVIEESLGGTAQLTSAHIPYTNSGSEKTTLTSMGKSQLSQLDISSRVKSADATAQANIKSRSVWGANQSWMDWTPEYAKFEAVVIHHTAGSNSYTQAQVPSVIQGIYRYHARTLGWGDIGYNVLIDKFGGRWEGRAGTLTSSASQMVIGGHAYPRNTNTLGVSVMGDYTQVQPTTNVINALVDVTAWRFILAKVNPTTASPLTIPAETSTRKNQIGKPMPRIVGHKDVGATACPGSIYNYLDTIRSKVSQAYQAASISYKNVDKLATDNKKVLADGVYTVNSLVNKNVVLDVAGGSWAEDANLQVWTGNGTTAQKFRVSHDAQGYVVIESVVSGRVLDVADGVSKSGVNIRQHTKNGSRAQKWVAVKRGGGIELVSALSRDGVWLVLDLLNARAVNGTNVQLWERNDNTAQRWVFTPTELISPGVYSVYSQIAAKGTRVLDVSNGSVSSGANIWSYTANGTLAQNFYISEPNSSGSVSIQALISGLYVGVDSSGNVVQSSNGSASSQRWKVQSHPDGSFAFVNVATGKFLDVHNSSTTPGANVKVWQSNGGNAQKWRLIEQPSPLPDGLYSIHPKSDYNKVLDVANGSKSNGANIWLYQSNGTLAQKWHTSRNSDNTYTFVAANSGLAMDIDGGRMVNGANVQQYTKWPASNKNTAAQRFYVTWDPKFGGFKIAAKNNSSLTISLGAEKTANKTNIILWKDHNVPGERFTFKGETLTSASSSDNLNNYFDNKAGGAYIMGKSAATVDDMVAMYEKTGYKYPSAVLSKGGAKDIKEFCTIIAREAAAEGVRADVVFIQAMLETGWLQFGNQVSASQFNFAGIGAVDGGASGARFASVSQGIRAQVQHLKAYASTAKLNNTCVDPRFHLVTRGVAPKIVDLSGRWASDRTYGNKIQTQVDKLDAMK